MWQGGESQEIQEEVWVSIREEHNRISKIDAEEILFSLDIDVYY